MIDIRSKLSEHSRTMKSSMIRELVASTKSIPGLISFAGGFPSPATFPGKQLAEIFKEVIEQDGADILQYGSSEGDTFLKQALRKFENLQDLTDNEMLITVGSTNAIFFVAQALIEPGDVVIAEGPSFLGSIVSFEAVGAEIHVVPVDGQGLSAKKLTEKIIELKNANRKIKFIYTIPEFQNPTGISMTIERKKEILNIAADNEILILEDNPYGQLRYSGIEEPSLFEIARKELKNKDLVICIKSFSKILGPGLRIAYAFGPELLIQVMGSWNQKVNISPDCVAQRAIARFIEKDFMTSHLEKIRNFYKPLCDAMLESLEKYMPEGVSWTKPDGGIFIWVYLPEYIDGDQLFEDARMNKVAFIPGSKFYPENAVVKNTIRLNFSYPTVEQIEEGVKRLAEIIRIKIK